MASNATTFVQADPSTFRAVVQKLTGAQTNPSPEKRHKRPLFRLHERRRSSKKLELDLNNNNNNNNNNNGILMASPVSTLEFLSRRSPGTPLSPCEEEEKAIAKKGFFFHPGPVRSPAGSDPPELLPLFPLCSPRDHCNVIESSSS